MAGGTFRRRLRILRCLMGNYKQDLEVRAGSFDQSSPLQSDIFRPFYHARKVASWLDVLTDTEISGPFFNQRVL